MEKKRQNLDNFFREKLSEFELSKKEGNWELLNHLLNEQERKKKNRKWFFLIFGFLILLTGGLFIMLPVKKSMENIKNSIGQSSTSAPAESNSIKNKTGKSTAPVSSNKNETGKEATNNVEYETSENTSVVNDKANSSHIIEVEKETARPVATPDSVTEHSAIIQAEINLAQQPNISPGDSAEPGVEQVSQPESPAVYPTRAGDSASAYTSAQQQASNDSMISSDSTITTSVVSDSLAVITKDNSPADSASAKPDTVKRNFLSFNFYAGVNIYSTSSAFTNKENISPIAGLELTHPLSSKFSIGLAGLYSLQGGYHLEDSVKVSQQTYFLDVKEDVYEQTIQIRQLHKLYFPLALYYTVAGRHSLSAAFQYSYLLNTSGIYTEKNTIAGITNESQKNNVKGYMDGIKSTNMAVSLGYRYRLSKTFDFSTHITRELTEAYIKDYFYGVNTNPSWTFQTFLIVKF